MPTQSYHTGHSISAENEPFDLIEMDKENPFMTCSLGCKDITKGRKSSLVTSVEPYPEL